MTYPGRDEYRRLLRELGERHGPKLQGALADRYGADLDGFRRAAQAALGIAVEQEVRAHHDRDQVTIMECAVGCSAAKAVTSAGIGEYKCGKWFATTAVEVDGLARLAELLEQIQRQHRIFTIRGELIEGHKPGRVRKKCHPDPADSGAPYFQAKARRHLAVDLDSFALPAGVDPLDVRAVGEAGRALLPDEFRSAACWAQLTASAGYAPGGRARLWWWCSRPVSDAEVKRWLAGSRVDTSLYNPVQPHYVARPTFAPGVVDPVPVRSMVLRGGADVVTVPPLPEPARREAHSAVHGLRRNGADSHDYSSASFSPRSSQSARAQQYMAACLRGLAIAPHGQGRDGCTRVALRLFSLAKGGLLDPSDVTARIKAVMQHHQGWAADEGARGRTLADVNRQLQWAWDRAEPRNLT